MKNFRVSLCGKQEDLKRIGTLAKQYLQIHPAGCKVSHLVHRVPGLQQSQCRLVTSFAGDCCIHAVTLSDWLVLECSASEKPEKFFGALFRSSSLKEMEIRNAD